jgi:hypothetical protein
MVVNIMLCIPFPAAPKYCETTIAISKLKIAEKNLMEKVLNILLIIIC